MEVNAYRRGMGNIFKRLILSGVQEQKNSQQKIMSIRIQVERRLGSVQLSK